MLPCRYSRSSEEEIGLVSWGLECCSKRKTRGTQPRGQRVCRSWAGDRGFYPLHGQSPDAPHQVRASAPCSRSNSAAGSDPPAVPRVRVGPTLAALAQGEPGRWASGRLPAGGAGPPRPGPRSRAARTGSSVPLPLPCGPQAGVIDLQAGRKGAPWPLSETPVLCRRSDKGALEDMSDDLVRWFSLLGSELSFPHWH